MTTIPTRDESVVAEHRIKLDENALIAAAKYLDTESPAETVNAALREVAAMFKRREAFDRLAARGAAGQFDELMHKKDRP
ncbi:DUF2191 domain-containing protein [Symbioplanes lichenis]|uniref:DUF2191 domain-containing protein n=1 Tax=Symbioplanes lichenis TaxID=1629072 RepID=UPI0027392E71|nr:DUF2191 domain-containing protein [Actinoplanes lichenis]